MDTQNLSAPSCAQPLNPRGITHINTKHTTRFTVVGNHLTQHRRLSLTAIGLACHIQSLPSGSRVDIKTLAARFPEGETRIAAALRELEAHGYLARIRERLPSGRIVTYTVSYNQPLATVTPDRPKPSGNQPPQPPTTPPPSPNASPPQPAEPENDRPVPEAWVALPVWQMISGRRLPLLRSYRQGILTMLTKDEAVAAAAQFLKTLAYPDRADSVVVLPDTAIEFPYGWTVRFGFREHLDTGNRAMAPFSSVVVVPHAGAGAHLPPTHLPVAQYMELCARGDWPPTKGR
ncbi:YrhB domain-containing protein [Streptomyces sp. NPDC047085]|uniref:YrhB domain-containing protein n=1 Tax=Streptomyces sp. NPDC047085 TaxID=3155140 RepID=UPI0033D36ACC